MQSVFSRLAPSGCTIHYPPSPGGGTTNPREKTACRNKTRTARHAIWPIVSALRRALSISLSHTSFDYLSSWLKQDPQPRIGFSWGLKKREKVAVMIAMVYAYGSVNFQVHATKKKSSIQYFDLHSVLFTKVIFLVSDRGSDEVLKSKNTATFRIVNLPNISRTTKNVVCSLQNSVFI